MIDRRLSVAPMLDWTDRHCRYFHRQLTHRTLLYTEMITTGALLFGDAERHLHYDEAEHPLALQLGGSEPEALARCAKLAEAHGYDEINLNVGCPSDRVQNGAFGACLMATPLLVADCMKAMLDAVSVPVTIKHRIGIDDMESFDELAHFIGTVASSGCRIFIIHARKAWLQGLNPRQNREIPPLQYEFVYRLKQEFADLEIIINGGVETLDQAEGHLSRVDGVMIGRAAYHNPWLLADADRRLFGAENPVKSRTEVVERMIPYLEAHLRESGGKASHVTRHMLGLFNGQPGARKWRRALSENAVRKDAGVEVLTEALQLVAH
ncbi:MAG: tRNA dihydrouridine(20/20a) synthase DusA [Gammaproteobacteria bacterium]|jgi:tRNA-dihydrouridine synthase A